MATLTGAIGTGSKWLLDRIVGALAATGVNPNFLTFLGLVVNFAAAAMFAIGRFRTGALIILFAGFLDMLDGQVARRQNRVTAFGAFYDSTLDRYADMALYMGLLVYYSVSGRTPYVVLAAVATAGSLMVSCARARAESLIPLCKVGFMERPERLVLLIIGGLFNRMGPVLWVIAVVSTITVIHRIVYTWQETRAGRPLPGFKLSLYTLTTLQQFIIRLGHDSSHALTQCRHIFFGEPLRINGVVQNDGYFCRPEHPVTGAVMLEGSHQADGHNGNAELLRYAKAAVLELIHVAVACALGFGKNNQAGTPVNGVLRQAPHALEVRRVANVRHGNI